LEHNFAAIRLVAKGYVLDTRFEKAFSSDVCKRALAAFREHGIRPPVVLQQDSGPSPS
jgi:hypothetical protein